MLYQVYKMLIIVTVFLPQSGKNGWSVNRVISWKIRKFFNFYFQWQNYINNYVILKLKVTSLNIQTKN
jgi:hypothetical protein